jgi:hypothetical protein
VALQLLLAALLDRTRIGSRVMIEIANLQAERGDRFAEAIVFRQPEGQIFALRAPRNTAFGQFFGLRKKQGAGRVGDAQSVGLVGLGADLRERILLERLRVDLMQTF